MNSTLISIVSGIIIIGICALLSTDEDPKRKMTQDRLNKVKNRQFDISDDTKQDKHIKEFLNQTKTTGPIERALENSGLSGKIRTALFKAGSKDTVDSMITKPIFILILFGALAVFMPKFQIIFIAVGILLIIFPFVMLKVNAGKRADAFSEQFPEVLGLIASSLRAGHSLMNSFQIVTEDTAEPSSSIFKTVVDDISLGRDASDSIANMETFMPDSLDLRFFITAVLIQREIGGNLAEILDSLGETIRERFKLMGQLKAQTAQAKLSGIMLTLVPAIVGIIIWMMNPDYMEPLITTPTGKMILMGAVIFIFLGGFIMMKITDIEF